MIAKGVNNIHVLEDIADSLGMELTNTEDCYRGIPDRIKFTLRLKNGNEKYQSKKPRPQTLEWVEGEPITDEWIFRRMGRSVCFHGHYAFFDKLFEKYPNAEIQSSWYGDWKHTADTLQENAQEMGMQPLGPEGNIHHRFQLRECCDCTLTDNNPEGIY